MWLSTSPLVCWMRILTYQVPMEPLNLLLLWSSWPRLMAPPSCHLLKPTEHLSLSHTHIWCIRKSCQLYLDIYSESEHLLPLLLLPCWCKLSSSLRWTVSIASQQISLLLLFPSLRLFSREKPQRFCWAKDRACHSSAPNVPWHPKAGEQSPSPYHGL